MSNKIGPKNTIYSPILVSVYDRLEHFQRCISSLERCDEAKKSELFIASDLGKDKSSNFLVREIRAYASKITGFRKINLMSRKENYGQPENIHAAVRDIFKKHDRLIFLEDDVIVGKHFLKFLNYGLNEYFENDKIIGVSGHLPKEINSTDKPFFLNWRTTYGVGMWRHKELKLRTFSKDSGKLLAQQILKDKELFLKISKFAPQNVSALPLMAKGYLFAGDIEVGTKMFIKNKLSLYPNKQLTINNGNDGTGLHGGWFEKPVNEYKSIDFLPEINTQIEIKNSVHLSKLISNRYKPVWPRLRAETYYYLYNHIPIFIKIYVLFRHIKRKSMGFIGFCYRSVGVKN